MQPMAVMLAASLAVAAALPAQPLKRPMYELRPFVGAYVPTGDQRGLVEDAFLAGTTAAFELSGLVHVTATFAWAPNRDRARTENSGIDLLLYDLGLEFNLGRTLGGKWELKPFAALGAGGRTYHYRNAAADSPTYVAGYGALGTEFQLGRLAVRLEARDYLCRFKGLTGKESASTRNELTFATGVAYHFSL